MGEDPERVFNAGALGVENALHTPFLLPAELESDLGFPLFAKPYVVTTFHPVTLETETEDTQLHEMLGAIDKRQDLNFLITKANADIGGQHINKVLDAFSLTHSNCCVVPSLGSRRYMSALKYSACVLGNSSSGLIEAPSFGIPTVNIGSRQRGRIRGKSVIDCQPEEKDILRAMELAVSDTFRKRAAISINPYGNGNSSGLICKKIKDFLIPGRINLKKKFYDISY